MRGGVRERESERESESVRVRNLQDSEGLFVQDCECVSVRVCGCVGVWVCKGVLTAGGCTRGRYLVMCIVR